LELELEAESLRETNRALLKRSRAQGEHARDLAGARIVNVNSPAYEAAGPVFPTRKNILSLAVAAALLLGLLTAFLAEYFNPGVTAQTGRASRSADRPALGRKIGTRSALAGSSRAEAGDQGEVSLIPAAGEAGDIGEVVVPIPGDGRGIVPASEILMKQRSKFAAGISDLNERMLSRLGNGGPKVVLLTGQRSVGDKVSIAAALAALKAQQGRRVVLVDLTHGESEIHRAFGMQPVPGIAEVLTRSTTLTKAFRTDFRSHVTLLARGDFVDEQLAMRLLEVAPSLVAQLKKHFDLILMVTRNVDVAIEAEMFPSLLDLAIVVSSPEASGVARPAAKISAHPKLRRLHSVLLPVIVRR
jgi:Mrp family chromosome partitioning ATPase